MRRVPQPYAISVSALGPAGCCPRRLLSTEPTMPSTMVTAQQQASEGSDDHALPIPDAHQRHRRASDVATAKEKMIFLRDRSYAKHRPLPALPWRQLRYRTYMDDAERLHGRKETWPSIVAESPESFERFAAILKDHLRDLLEETRMEAKRARFFKQRCEQRREAYRSYIVAGLSEPSVLRAWARDELARMKQAKDVVDGAAAEGGVDSPRTSDGGTTSEDHRKAGSDAAGLPTSLPRQNDEAAELRRLQRRARAEEADLTDSPAMAELLDPRREAHAETYSAFPFLRRRAIEAKASLDPSLVDWSAKYFPDDDETTFEEPAALRGAAHKQQPATGVVGGGHDDREEGAARHGAVSSGSGDGSGHRRKQPSKGDKRAKPSQRMRRTLAAHLDASRASFDGEGLFFKLKRNSERLDGRANADEDRAATPSKAIKPSEWPLQRSEDARVVRVDWSTVVASRQAKKTPEVHRARERLIRLTRGENPETL